ncbi:MAG: hypothetical protein ACOC46_02600, partial [Pirellulales bacterium]
MLAKPNRKSFWFAGLAVALACTPVRPASAQRVGPTQAPLALFQEQADALRSEFIGELEVLARWCQDQGLAAQADQTRSLAQSP